MTHPTDDTLNSVWNDIVSGKEAGSVSKPDTTSAALLRAMHATAGTVEPDPVFRDQLWADLSRRPVISTPAPAAAASPPESFAIRSGAPTMTPLLAPSTRRWSPPIATIAAALVIALVGYGALSLSGANPSGINLNMNEVPNASAQGQGMAQDDNPVVGTWVVFSDGFSQSGAILQLVTFEPDGMLSVQFAFGWTGAASGKWSIDGSSVVHYDYTSLLQAEHLDANYSYGDPVLPLGVHYTGFFRLSEDHQSWVDYGLGGTLIAADQSGNPIRLSEPIDQGADPGSGILVTSPERLEHLLDRSPEMTAEQQAFFRDSEQSDDTPGLDVNAPPPSNHPDQVTVTPLPTYTMPTPTSAVNVGSLIAPTSTAVATRPATSTPTKSP